VFVDHCWLAPTKQHFSMKLLRFVAWLQIMQYFMELSSSSYDKTLMKIFWNVFASTRGIKK
jgi:hypothetical protein